MAMAMKARRFVRRWRRTRFLVQDTGALLDRFVRMEVLIARQSKQLLLMGALCAARLASQEAQSAHYNRSRDAFWLDLQTALGSHYTAPGRNEDVRGKILLGIRQAVARLADLEMSIEDRLRELRAIVMEAMNWKKNWEPNQHRSVPQVVFENVALRAENEALKARVMLAEGLKIPVGPMVITWDPVVPE